MPELVFVTGNADKFLKASQTFAKYGIDLLQNSPEIDEVQSEDSTYIARKKAEAAYEILKQPVLISDDSWAIVGLNGFPGPYMKSMNHWLDTDAFLRLTKPMTDRTVLLKQLLVYKDQNTVNIFELVSKGEILHEARGAGNVPWTRIVVMEGDNGKTIAEVYDEPTDHSQRKHARILHEFAQWYKEYAA